MLKVRQDGAPHQSVLAVSNTPENQQWQMPNKAHNSAIRVQIIHQNCKEGYKDRQRGEKRT